MVLLSLNIIDFVGPAWDGGFLTAYMLAMIFGGLVCGFLSPKGFWFLLPFMSFLGQTLAVVVMDLNHELSFPLTEIRALALFSIFNLMGIILGLLLNFIAMNLKQLENQRGLTKRRK